MCEWICESEAGLTSVPPQLWFLDVSISLCLANTPKDFLSPCSSPAGGVLEDPGGGLGSTPALCSGQEKPGTRAKIPSHSPSPDCMSLGMPQASPASFSPYGMFVALVSATVIG